ncbi:hypothetical protein F5144DRAFT_479557 [Chaetomium tenue]|uniref:Uncharacterized protein n=1 Tax=Chaetomium tenue TaxID=1854479 RepID=A0ACB7PLI0_9PEZI|nr:hypothetical protein F5144DRAFT_479557 [Chaetomium globosum]
MDLDGYQCTPSLGRPRDMSMAGVSAFSGIPSPPEVILSSSRTSNTPGTDMMSVDYELGLKASEFTMAAPAGNSIPEFEVVLVAEGAWNFARCNPPTFTGSCPRTAIVHLECLEQKSKQEGTWSALEKHMEQFDWDVPDLASVVPLTSRTRDKMLAITQSFLHKALDIHRGGHAGYSKHGYSRAGDCNFIVLPPSKILECFLRSYVRSLSVYYPLVAAGCVDPNEMLQNNQASTLLVLLMIAQGAATMPIPEARHLSAGLTETCRISLFDIVEKDVELSADPTALRCALLFIVLGAWSGDKWLMDIAMGQRGMYMSVSKTLAIPEFGDAVNIELQWRAWVQRETRNRLVYNYVMLDQELSLFHDTAPLFAITELQCPLPAPEVLWMSTSSERWFTAMQSLHDCTANVNPQLLSATSAASSLYELFQDFLQDNLMGRQPNVSPQQLRLILHPLQSMIYHFRQTVSCFSTTFGTPHTSGCSVNRNSMLHRLDEMQVLLQRWYDITMSHSKENPGCPITRCNSILYHLVYLNAITDFSEIERLARREGFGGLHWELSMRHSKCISQRQKAIIHCGQVIRLLRTMPKDRRPVWWSAAMYRAMLILWADSISRVDPDIHADKHGNIGGQDTSPVMIDQLTLEDPAIINYMWSGEGMPVLVRPGGSPVAATDPAGILGCAVRNIETCYGSRIGDGIKRKLITLGNNWNLNVLGGSPPGAGC